MSYQSGNEQIFGDQMLTSAVHSRIKVDVIEKRRSLISDDESFFVLAKQLSDQYGQGIDYHSFKLFATVAPSKVKRYFTASNFLLFQRDENTGTISCDDFLRYVQRSIDVETASLMLLSHASNLHFMTEKEVERYIFEMIPDMISCQRLDRSFYPFYVFTASRRFFFFLDPKRSQRISVKKMAHSTVMEELLFLKRIAQYEKDMDPNTFAQQMDTNWFSGHNSIRVYKMFTNLDTDRNGTLRKEELMGFSGVSPREPVQLTTVAILRIFEENITYQPMEMDYKTFLDLVLALENKTTAEALGYFWRILDIEKTGRLTPQTIRFFYQEVAASLQTIGYEAPNVANVTAEIYDLLSCNDSRGPSQEDFMRSGQGHTVVSMLIDVEGFWAYDNRESLMQQPDSDSLEPELDTDGSVPAYTSFSGTASNILEHEEEFEITSTMDGNRSPTSMFSKTRVISLEEVQREIRESGEDEEEARDDMYADDFDT